MAASFCRVRGHWTRQNGELKPGSYRVEFPTRVTDAADETIWAEGFYGSGRFVGDLAIDLPPNDDPGTFPHGWQLKLTVSFRDGSDSEVYVIDTPSGGEVDLSTIVLPDTWPAPAPVVIGGVPGGFALLDSEGNVLNGDGEVVGAVDPAQVVAAVEEAVEPVIGEHVDSETPHPAYDEGIPSLQLLFENGLI